MIKKLVITIKDTLKQVPLFYKINAAYKSFLYKKKLNRLRFLYNSINPPKKYDEQLVLESFKNKYARFFTDSERPRVFWIGSNYDQDHTGFIQALKRHAEVDFLIQPNGQYGFAKSKKLVDREVLKYNHRVIIDLVNKITEKKKIDLVWGQMWSNCILPDTLMEIKQRGIPVINIAMDDRLPYLWENYEGYRLGAVGLKNGVDMVLTTVKECVDWYHKENIPAIYWPLGSDKDIFYPAPVKEYDVSFIGNNYGIRGDIVRAIQRAGIRVEAFGRGFPNGYVDCARSPEIFSKSKIILGIGTIGHTKDLFTMKLRDFDGPMSGALYITTRTEELCELYEEDKEIVLYSSIEELVEKIKYYLQNEDKLNEIVVNGRNKAIARYTWDARVQQVLSLLKR